MIPLFRKVKSQAEKDELLRQARAEWDAIPGELKHLVASSDEDYIAKVADSIEVEPVKFVAPREASAAELAKQNGELLFEQMYGPRIDHGTGIAALDELSKANQDAELRKLLGPADRGETWLEEMVRKAINKVQSVPRRESEREGIHPAMSAMGRDDSPVGRFVKAWIDRDTAAMREIVRERELAAV